MQQGVRSIATLQPHMKVIV